MNADRWDRLVISQTLHKPSVICRNLRYRAAKTMQWLGLKHSVRPTAQRTTHSRCRLERQPEIGHRNLRGQGWVIEINRQRVAAALPERAAGCLMDPFNPA